jgi:hypothetical protein
MQDRLRAAFLFALGETMQLLAENVPMWWQSFDMYMYFALGTSCAWLPVVFAAYCAGRRKVTLGTIMALTALEACAVALLVYGPEPPW